MIPEPDNLDARSLQNLRPFLIVAVLFFIIVSTTVKLDRQFGRMAVEVKDVASERVLAAKFETAEAMVAQEVPHESFCVGLALTKLSGKSQQFLWDAHLSPSPALRAPSPSGRGESSIFFQNLIERIALRRGKSRTAGDLDDLFDGEAKVATGGGDDVLL